MTTHIEWTDDTWNPVSGCDRVSPGCDHCYALTMANRLKGMGRPGYQVDGAPSTSGPGFGVSLHPWALEQPLRWRKPRRIFVNSMGDLFHEAVPDDYIARVFATMATAAQHTYQVLTKRHARMRSLVNSPAFREDVETHYAAICSTGPSRQQMPPAWDEFWPLPNVWLGVSVENQKWANIRIPALLETPAAVRFLSCEPLLGPIDLTQILERGGGVWSALDRGTHHSMAAVDWVIVGGESGANARPMHPAWPRRIRDQCVAAGIPYLFKQHGEWVPGSHPTKEPHVIVWDGRHEPAIEHQDPDGKYTQLALDRLAHRQGASHGAFITRVGKKAAGRELDGRTWDEYPQTDRQEVNA